MAARLIPVAHPGELVTTATAFVGPAFFVPGLRPYLHTRRQVNSDGTAASGVPPLETEAGWWRTLPARQWPDLADLVSGTVPGRTEPAQTALFINTIGTGLPFAALGRLIWERAEAQNPGHYLPDTWFTQSVPP